jgi:hypothetical protein
MSENLQWEKRNSKKNALAEKLESLMNDVVIAELNDINSKIESLCAMGVLKDNEHLDQLRKKMKNLQTGNKDDCNK